MAYIAERVTHTIPLPRFHETGSFDLLLGRFAFAASFILILALVVGL